MNKVSYEDLINYLKNNTDTLKNIVLDAHSYNSELEDYMWYENNEYFYEDYFSSKEEIARAVYYGDYNFTDEYVRFNAYGNLETTNEFGLIDELQRGAEEILDVFLDLYADTNIDTNDEVFKGMISDYYNSEESEVKDYE